MSVMGMPQGKGEVGETVASFPTYEGAQKAVSTLIAGEVPARDIAIVGFALRSVERITGRLGYAAAARSGAINGLLLGMFFSALFVLGNASAPISAFVGVLFIGIAIGMLFSIVSYAIVRRRRDYASVMQVVADHYEVTVAPGSIHRARQIMGPRATAPRPAPFAPPAAPAGDRPATPQEPPQYGERIPPAEPPRYGERVPDQPVEAEPAPVVDADTGDAEAADGAGRSAAPRPPE